MGPALSGRTSPSMDTAARASRDQSESMIGAQDMVRGGSGNRRRSESEPLYQRLIPLLGSRADGRRQWLNTIDAVLHWPDGAIAPLRWRRPTRDGHDSCRRVHDTTKSRLAKLASDLAGGAHPSEARVLDRARTRP